VDAQPAADPAPRPAPDARLGDALAEAAGARLRLLEAEAQRAALAAATLGALAVAAALLAVTAWLVLAGALVFAAASAGVPWWLGALVVIGLHVAGAFLLVRRAKAALQHLSFAATRRTLTGAFRRPRST
jgi:hypothetical protein